MTDIRLEGLPHQLVLVRQEVRVGLQRYPGRRNQPGHDYREKDVPC